jgi:hypothetical protein
MKLAPVQTSAPEAELAARVEGAPAPAALESFADFLLERIQNDTNAARRPVLTVIQGPARRRD